MFYFLNSKNLTKSYDNELTKLGKCDTNIGFFKI